MDCTIARAVGTAANATPSADADMLQQLQRKDMQLREMQHRMGNSLQIVASILLLKARAAQSEEAKLHLRDAHGRIMSIASIQKRLQVSNSGDRVDIGAYLPELCASLDESMVGGTRPISIAVNAQAGMVCGHDAVSIGLIVTELVINALKHAFGPDDVDCRIVVAYEIRAAGWRLCVRDNGGGQSGSGGEKPTFGLGSSIVEALSRQLGARRDVVRVPGSYETLITRE